MRTAREHVLNILPGLLAFACLCAIASYFALPLSNDIANKLMDARKLLAGVPLYNVNLPVTSTIYLVPVSLSLLTHIPLEWMFKAYALLLAFLSLSLVNSLEMTISDKAKKLLVVALAFAYFVVPLRYSGIIGDKESLLILFVTPLVVILTPGLLKNELDLKSQLLFGVLAGIGFGIKPHFLIIYAAILFAQLATGEPLKKIVTSNTHRAVFLTVMAVHTLILLCTDYYQSVVPLAVESYGALSLPLYMKKEIWGIYFIPLLPAILFGFYMAWVDRRARYLFLITLGMLANTFVNAGWRYTAYPGDAYCCLTGIYGAYIVFTRHARPIGIVLATLALIGMVYAYLYKGPEFQRQNLMVRVSPHFISKESGDYIHGLLANNKSFAMVSVQLWGGQLVDYMQPTYPVSMLRYDYLWPLATIKDYEREGKKKEAQQLKWKMLSGIATDIEMHKPDIVVIDISPGQRTFSATSLSMEVLYLKNTPLSAVLAQDYEPKPEAQDFCPALKQQYACKFITYRKKP